jgi:hypothetical protein
VKHIPIAEIAITPHRARWLPCPDSVARPNFGFITPATLPYGPPDARRAS